MSANRLTVVRTLPAHIAGLLGLVAASTAVGQITDPLVTDRPSFSVSAATVRPGRAQLESGYTFSRDDGETHNSIGELLARIGVVSRLELRLALNSYHVAQDASGEEAGFEDIYIGAKVVLADAASAFSLLRPGVALLLGTSLPTGKQGFGGEGVWPELGLALVWSVSHRVTVASNLIAESVRIDGDRFGQFSGSLLMSYAFAERLGTYLEYYGFASSKTRGLDDSFLNGGLTFLASNDLQFDARVGIGLNDPDLDYFLGLGFSWRI